MIIQLIAGCILATIGFYGHSNYSGVLFVEGMIITNMALFKGFRGKSLEHL